MNPYQQYINQAARLRQEGQSLPLGGFAAAPRPEIASDAPCVLIFAPHPDDECIIGALPLRLLRESRMNVINVAVTQGSNKARQDERFRELQSACEYIGFGLIQSQPGGLERVHLKTRHEDPEHWSKGVRILATLLEQYQPQIVFFPHANDWNTVHEGTHAMVVDALATLGPSFSCHTVETEFWGQMTDPNLMVESSELDVADLVAGTSFHVGEVRRNPYHLLLPAWMQDNVRRGGELVGGQGAAAPLFTFATLYRLGRWNNGQLERREPPQRFLTSADQPAVLFS